MSESYTVIGIKKSTKERVFSLLLACDTVDSLINRMIDGYEEKRADMILKEKEKPSASPSVENAPQEV
jgi:hypothetical protein